MQYAFLNTAEHDRDISKLRKMKNLLQCLTRLQKLIQMSVKNVSMIRIAKDHLSTLFGLLYKSERIEK